MSLILLSCEHVVSGTDSPFHWLVMGIQRAAVSMRGNTGLFISPSGTSELDCATTKKDTAERSISIRRESLKVFFVLGALAYLQVPLLGGSRDEKWRAQ